jgi:hypothetical protein
MRTRWQHGMSLALAGTTFLATTALSQGTSQPVVRDVDLQGHSVTWASIAVHGLLTVGFKGEEVPPEGPSAPSSPYRRGADIPPRKLGDPLTFRFPDGATVRVSFPQAGGPHAIQHALIQCTAPEGRADSLCDDIAQQLTKQATPVVLPR